MPFTISELANQLKPYVTRWIDDAITARIGVKRYRDPGVFTVPLQIQNSAAIQRHLSIGGGLSVGASSLIANGGAIRASGGVVAPGFSTDISALAYGNYSTDILAASGADRSVFRAGVLGVSNGFVVAYISSLMNYIFNDGDVYTTAYQDYSATSTVTGWSSFSTKRIYYKKIGKLVFVVVFLSGTSNGTAVTFTVPYTAAAGGLTYQPCWAVNNGVDAVGKIFVNDSSSTVTVYSTIAGGAWTGSGTKAIVGQFFYEAAT